MTRACGNCSKSCKKYGKPVRHGPFLDQIVDCEHCGWCGVETEILDDDTEQAEVQLEFDMPP